MKKRASPALPKHIREEISRQRTSPVGKALARFGYRPIHQGGNLVNYCKRIPGGEECITDHGRNADGWGPLKLSQRMAVYRITNTNDGGRPVKTFKSVSAFVASKRRRKG